MGDGHPCDAGTCLEVGLPSVGSGFTRSSDVGPSSTVTVRHPAGPGSFLQILAPFIECVTCSPASRDCFLPLPAGHASSGQRVWPQDEGPPSHPLARVAQGGCGEGSNAPPRPGVNGGGLHQPWPHEAAGLTMEGHRCGVTRARHLPGTHEPQVNVGCSDLDVQAFCHSSSSASRGLWSSE